VPRAGRSRIVIACVIVYTRRRNMRLVGSCKAVRPVPLVPERCLEGLGGAFAGVQPRRRALGGWLRRHGLLELQRLLLQAPDDGRCTPNWSCAAEALLRKYAAEAAATSSPNDFEWIKAVSPELARLAQSFTFKKAAIGGRCGSSAHVMQGACECERTCNIVLFEHSFVDSRATSPLSELRDP
jgi:hypothetical protein